MLAKTSGENEKAVARIFMLVNISSQGTKEIERLEKQLLALNRKKLTLQSQLQQAELKNTQLELKALQEPPETNSLWRSINWPLWLGLAGLVVWFVAKGGNDD